MFSAIAIAFRFIAGGLLNVARWMFANPAAALCILLAIGGAYEWNRARWLDVTVATQEKAIATLAAQRDTAIKRANKADADAVLITKANATMQEAIAALQSSLDAATALTAQAKAASSRALARLKVSEAARRAAESRETETRSAIYENDPTCNAWGSLPVCPAIAVRLRSSETRPGPS